MEPWRRSRRWWLWLSLAEVNFSLETWPLSAVVKAKPGPLTNQDTHSYLGSLPSVHLTCHYAYLPPVAKYTILLYFLYLEHIFYKRSCTGSCVGYKNECISDFKILPFSNGYKNYIQMFMKKREHAESFIKGTEVCCATLTRAWSLPAKEFMMRSIHPSIHLSTHPFFHPSIHHLHTEHLLCTRICGTAGTWAGSYV